MDNVPKVKNCANISYSQTFRSYHTNHEKVAFVKQVELNHILPQSPFERPLK
jgi:hypothetical protein